MAVGNQIEAHDTLAISKSGERHRLKPKSRHAVKHDSSLLRFIDRLNDWTL
jgi:hypothetical protein